MRTPTLPLSLRRAVARHRRLLAAVAAALAVAATITALQPERGPTVAVVAAARPVAGGATVTDADVTLIPVPAALVPVDALTAPADAVGQTVNAPVTERSILTRATVATGQALARPGLVVVPLPLTDEAIAPLVRPGSRIDLYGGAAGSLAAGSGPLATDVRVVAAPEGPSGGFGSLSSSRVALVEVTPEVASTLAQVGRQGGVTIALH